MADLNENKLITLGNLKKYTEKIKELISNNSYQKITYSDLKDLRDNSLLVPGTWYRITDYETTVFNNNNVRSAGHLFDIVVLATDVNQLSEDAKAVHSARDTEGYFAHANLDAWKLKYSLDNDTTKFTWAGKGGEKWTIKLPVWETTDLTPVSTNDSTYEGFPYKFTCNLEGKDGEVYFAHLELQEGEDFIPNVLVVDGMDIEMINEITITEIVRENQTAVKGVIWEMEDEYNNICPYDFKNVQFERSLIIATKENPSEEECAFYGKYVGPMEELPEEAPALPDGYAIDMNNSKFLYTFSVITADGTVEDNSMGVDLTSAGMGIMHFCKSNRIRENINNTNIDNTSHVFDLNNNVFVSTCNSADEMMNLLVMGNTFGIACKNNTFVNGALENTFGNDCHYNSFGYYCYENSFGHSCGWNTFENDCYGNTSENQCSNNLFGRGCYNNSFGNGCYENSFGNGCSLNSFRNECYNNSFGNGCWYNSFGNNCDDNSFGNSCDDNSFGNDCDYNSFGNHCESNSFGNDCQYNDIPDNVQDITLFEGVQYVSIGSDSGTVQYAQILNGTSGSDSSNKLQINFATGKNYTQVAGQNSNGELKIWVPADLVQ